MFGDFFRKKSFIDEKSAAKRLRQAFSEIKKEFNEHLDAINENTNEIQSNYETLLRLESKMDKMESKLNEIQAFVDQFKTQNVYFIDDENNTFTIIPLNEKEKQAFKAIYELEAENAKITYGTVADLLGISTSLAREYVMSLIEKGVPIMKSYLDHKVYLSLEPKFKELQTKKNIVSL